MTMTMTRTKTFHVQSAGKEHRCVCGLPIHVGESYTSTLFFDGEGITVYKEGDHACKDEIENARLAEEESQNEGWGDEDDDESPILIDTETGTPY